MEEVLPMIGQHDYRQTADIIPLHHNAIDSDLLTACHVQDCKWHFLLFSGTFQTRLSVREEPHHLRLTFNLLDGSIFMRDFVGQWQVSPT